MPETPVRPQLGFTGRPLAHLVKSNLNPDKWFRKKCREIRLVKEDVSPVQFQLNPLASVPLKCTVEV
jgi:hypothetical protein